LFSKDEWAMNKRRYLVGIEIGAAALAVLLASLNLVHGNLNQDEGWYLYAAKMVHEGARPYADFAFTQGPVLPYVYSMLHPVIDALGVAAGRLLTSWFGVLAGMLAAATAARMTERNKGYAFAAVLLLVCGNVYQSYFTTIVKTYGLCSFLLMGGFFALTFRRWHGALLAGVLMALAAGTRLSAGIVLPITGIWLICQRERRLAWLWFGIGGGLTLLAVFAPFFVSAFEQTCFGLFGYHAGRDPGGMKALLVLKMGFVSRFVQAYFVFTALLLATICWHPRQYERNSSMHLMWMCGIGISLVHFVAAFPYDDYQAIAYPVLAVALVVYLIPKMDEAWLVPVLSFLFLVSIAAAFSSPLNQDWFVRGRDRIWWQFKEKSDLAQLRDAADIVRANSPEGSMLLTQDVYLAVDARRRVPANMEMGPFCYYPEMPRERAEKLHLLNREMLLETLTSVEAPLAAFSGYGLAIESPSISTVDEVDAALFRKQLERGYEPMESVAHFGQAHTTLEIYLRKDDE
jgi:hypothetical protein